MTHHPSVAFILPAALLTCCLAACSPRPDTEDKPSVLGSWEREQVTRADEPYFDNMAVWIHLDADGHFTLSALEFDVGQTDSVCGTWSLEADSLLALQQPTGDTIHTIIRHLSDTTMDLLVGFETIERYKRTDR